ncbi:hypothetical protein AMTRI_Chr06g190890 [Amborella trichopoda]
MDDGSQLLKALNVLMLKILDNAERTSSFVVLITLLRPLDPSKWPLLASGDTFAARILLSNVLQSTIFEVDVDRILQIIHLYLQELGMEEIRKRFIIRPKLQGTAIKGYLSMVPLDLEPQPIILAHIDLNLQTLAAARMLTPSRPIGQTQWGDSVYNGPSPATHSADA